VQKLFFAGVSRFVVLFTVQKKRSAFQLGFDAAQFKLMQPAGANLQNKSLLSSLPLPNVDQQTIISVFLYGTATFCGYSSGATRRL
jgi:hypothetical protein